MSCSTLSSANIVYVGFLPLIPTTPMPENTWLAWSKPAVQIPSQTTVPEHIEKKPVQPKRAKPQKKKSNALLITAIIAAPLLMICGLGLAYLFVSAQTPRLVPADVAALPSDTAQPSPPTVDSAPTSTLLPPTVLPSCNGLMSAQGVNLNAYSTIESAADVKDILKVLGYQKVNLYGASYGTRLAQVVMREYPEIVQSAILDSVVPVDANIFNRYPESSESALKALFETCKSDPKCNAAYPDLEAVFWNIVSKLEANPVTVTTSTYPIGTVTESMTGSTFMSVVLGSIKSSRFISTAPQTIARFEMGDYDPDRRTIFPAFCVREH
ncbi:MAG: alpha/beta hydrolase [Anaerolineales bacterium]|uniref:alpha/beta fold hydrolase n=1 Tax=Candidatus Villigracilis proximus TaxID=3140683 RepID=UPI003134B4A8|nr:alpha/beta hydrolase [Anaerolineales bacterium]